MGYFITTVTIRSVNELVAPKASSCHSVLQRYIVQQYHHLPADGSEICIWGEPRLPSSGMLRTIMTVPTATRWRNLYNAQLVQWRCPGSTFACNRILTVNGHSGCRPATLRLP
jgi:hypothetical protein